MDESTEAVTKPVNLLKKAEGIMYLLTLVTFQAAKSLESLDGTDFDESMGPALPTSVSDLAEVLEITQAEVHKIGSLTTRLSELIGTLDNKRN